MLLYVAGEQTTDRQIVFEMFALLQVGEECPDKNRHPTNKAVTCISIVLAVLAFAIVEPCCLHTVVLIENWGLSQ